MVSGNSTISDAGSDNVVSQTVLLYLCVTVMS